MLRGPTWKAGCATEEDEGMPTRTDVKPRDEFEIVEHDLHAEFEEIVPREELSRIAREELDAFGSARVRDYVPILAWRQARNRVLATLGLGRA
jgi:hypothetical protein